MGTEQDERQMRAASFAGVADAYERARPGYPDDAVRWLAGDRPCDVLDLGAGTGKLTRSLAAIGHRMTAVEPLEPMLLQLRAAVPGIDGFLGSAEMIPLPDESVDVVTCAQAFHWFDHALALPEIARVLRPGGRLALIWNMRGEREPWVDELSDAMVGRTGFVHTASDTIERSGLYGPVERAVFDHVQEIDRGALQELVISRSYCAILPPEERAPILEKVDAIFDERSRDGILRLPYVTECFRANVGEPMARSSLAGET
jgi:ubiquinone/menaquinone biosynthesis C-methylase UbiE